MVRGVEIDTLFLYPLGELSMIKRLAVSVLSIASFNTYALTCSGVLDEVGVNSSGDVEIIAEFLGNTAVRLCQDSSVEDVHNLSPEMAYNHTGYSTVCKTWLSIAEISVVTNTPVTIEYSSGDDCKAIPSGVDSITPSKVSITQGEIKNAD
jgi:hypothetical protein